MLPTLRQLQYLKLLAEHGSFSRAAEAANVTQPTLSAGVQELEKILGSAPVVDRARSGVILTPVGEEAVRRAGDILAQAEDLLQAAKSAGQPLTGRFRLGVIPTIAPFLLPKVLSGVRGALSPAQALPARGPHARPADRAEGRGRWTHGCHRPTPRHRWAGDPPALGDRRTAGRPARQSCAGRRGARCSPERLGRRGPDPAGRRPLPRRDHALETACGAFEAAEDRRPTAGSPQPRWRPWCRWSARAPGKRDLPPGDGGRGRPDRPGADHHPPSGYGPGRTGRSLSVGARGLAVARRARLLAEVFQGFELRSSNPCS